VAKSYAVLVGIAVFWCGITGLFLGFVVTGVARHVDAQRRFRETEGTVISSDVHRSHGSKTWQYRPKIAYRYEVAGKEYRSERYTFDESSSSSAQRFSQRIVDAHPAGSRVRVHYDPKAPEVAILDPSIPARLGFHFLFLQPFLTIAVALIACLLTHFPAKRRLRRFLAEPSSFPWEVPTWGTMTWTNDRLAIEHRPPGVSLVGAAYLLTSFCAIFVVGFAGLIGFEGFFEAPGWAIAAGFAASVASALLLGSWMARSRRRTVTVDREARTLTVAGAKDIRMVRFDEVKSLHLSRPMKMTKKGDFEPGDPHLAAHLKHGAPVFLHDFESPWKADEVAQKAASLLADALRTKLTIEKS
jgi:hypothetical protein